MFFELIATFCAGIGAAGLVMVANVLTGGRLPKWGMPVAAGLVMIGFSVWSEYTWADRTLAELPPGFEVLSRVEESKWYKPWTYVVPQVTRLMTLDAAGARTNDLAPQTRLVDLYLFARWKPPVKVGQLVDCKSFARADATGASLADPDAADWQVLGAKDKLIALSCAAPLG